MGAHLSVLHRPQKLDKQRPDPPPCLPPLEFPPPRRCTICFESDTLFPDSTPTPGCTHPVDVCVSCLETYVCTNIEGGTLTLKCPTLLCAGKMDVNEIQASIAGKHKEVFDRFCELKVRFQLQTEAALFWCKASGCGAGQIHVGGAAWPIITCQKCSARACFTHDTVWHEGKTCAKFTEDLKLSPKRALEAKKSEIWISSNTKPCPGEGCNRPIQKNNGCDHMTCRKPAGCGHEFCWQCLAPYGPIRNQGNKLHDVSCKHYA